MTITEIEKLARKTGEQVMGEVTEALVEEESDQQVSNLCPQCGKKMQYKGLKGRGLITDTGEVRLERGYYYCKSCRTGVFPLDHRLGLGESAFSPELARQMVWAGSLLP